MCKDRANWGLSLQQPRNRNKSATTAWKWKQVNKSLVIALLNRLCSMTNLKEQSRTATALYVCSFQNTPLRWREGFFGGWRERLFWQKKFCKGGALQLVQTNLAQPKDHLLTLGASTIWAGVATCTWTARWRKGRVRKQMVTAHVLGAWWPNLAEVLSMTSFVQMHLWST